MPRHLERVSSAGPTWATHARWGQLELLPPLGLRRRMCRCKATNSNLMSQAQAIQQAWQMRQIYRASVTSGRRRWRPRRSQTPPPPRCVPTRFLKHAARGHRSKTYSRIHRLWPTDSAGRLAGRCQHAASATVSAPRALIARDHSLRSVVLLSRAGEGQGLAHAVGRGSGASR